MSDPRIPYYRDDGEPERPDRPPEDRRPENENESGSGPGPGPDTYSATVLGSHWFERPDPTLDPAGDRALDPAPPPRRFPRIRSRRRHRTGWRARSSGSVPE